MFIMSRQLIDYGRPSPFRRRPAHGVVWCLAAVIVLTIAVNAAVLYLAVADHARVRLVIMLVFGPLANVILICIFFLLAPVARRLFGASNVPSYLMVSILAPMLAAGVFWCALLRIW